MNPATIDLHIETLALDGLPGADGQAVRAAIEHALSGLIAERGLPAGLATARGTYSVDRLDGGSFPVGQPGGDGQSASGLGRDVAMSIYRGIGR